MENLLSDNEPLREIISKHEAAIVNKAIDSLKEKYRSILLLKYFEELSYEEISDVLEMPPGTVATQLHRAKKALQKKIGTLLAE